MMQQFLKIIECLKTDEFYAVMIEDAETNQQFTVPGIDGKPTVNLTGQNIIAAFGTVEAFFNSIFEKGHERIKITFRRKNGSTFKQAGEPREFSLNAEKKQPKAEFAKSDSEPKMPKDFAKGLTGTQYFNALRYPEIVVERDELKRKLGKYKKKVAKLERAALEESFSTKKQEKNNELLVKLAPYIQPILGKVIPGAATDIPVQSGMNAPAELTETKIGVFQRISALSDDEAYSIGLLAENMQNESLQTDIMELINKHNLETE